MIVATHRVVGVLEWPTGSEPFPNMLAMLDSEIPAPAATGSRVLSLRLPLPEGQNATVLAADVGQLRRDLHRLFAEFGEVESVKD